MIVWRVRDDERGMVLFIVWRVRDVGREGIRRGFGGINSLNRLVTRSSSEPNPSGEH